MALLTVQDLGKVYGVDIVFQGVSFVLNEGEKMGLVGRNGAGKTTLLRLVAGLDEVEIGQVSLAGGASLGYLRQDPHVNPGLSLEEEARRAFAHLMRWEEELRELEHEMAQADGEALAALMERYTRLTARFEAAGGYDYPARARMVLFGLGFNQEDLQRPAGVLSGGQKVRLGLAKLLLTAPDLLLLDEPTNHLDLAATEWLEEHLRQFRGAALVVSHDRYFLDRVTTRTLELADGRARIYGGAYSAYLTAKEALQEQDVAAWQRQQEEITRLSAFIQKFKAGTRSRQAKSKEKMLERMERLERPRTRQKQMGLRFAMDQESAAEVLRLDGLGKSFGETVLFRGVSDLATRGDRIALVGPNGAGKTTLLRILAGRLEPSEGAHWWGVGVEFAYFSQQLDQVSDENTVLGEILSLPGMTQFHARTLLGRFLFPGEAVEKAVASLSGGERTRLTLAKLVCSGANVLLLDEPTNHLDLAAKQVLEDALVAFPGTVLVVSHDRYFLDRVARRVWELERGELAIYDDCNYTGYKEEKARRVALAAEGQAASPNGASTERSTGAQAERSRTAPQQPGDGQSRDARAEDRRARAEQRKQRAEIRRLEQLIAAKEEDKQELEQQMAAPERFKGPEARELVARYQVLNRELERLYVEWEKAAEEVEAGGEA